MAITKEKLIYDATTPEDGDSVAAFLRTGTEALTSTGGALDINVTNASLAVTATDLDIRDLAFATDSVDVTGSDVTATVSATDLDIRDLAFATDSVDVSGSAVSITGDVNVTQGTSPWVVSATNLDIRDLTSVSDSVTAVVNYSFAEDSAHASGNNGAFVLAVRNDAGTALAADGDYIPFTTDSSGALRVSGSLTMLGQYAEDSAHTTGAIGIYNLAVRSDAPATATSANGDYASQTVDAFNRSWVNPGSNISMATGAAVVTTTSALVVAAAAGRRKILIQNLGSKAIYLGASGVATSDGIRIAAGGNTELEIGPALALHAVAESGSQDVRYMQLA